MHLFHKNLHKKLPSFITTKQEEKIFDKLQEQFYDNPCLLVNGFKEQDMIKVIKEMIKDKREMVPTWKLQKDKAIKYKHPTQKPVELSVEAIDKTTKPKAVILDLFLGSGSTLIACEKLDRICYGMEL